MRVTCLKCGSQYDVEYDTSSVAVNCECGPSISYPEVHDAGVVPSERAAERLRYRAFHSAGLVRNIGVVALTVSAISILFFPLAVVGIGIGLYTLLGTRGPLKRYVGRQQATAAIALGLVVFLVEGSLAIRWMEQRRIRRVNDLQASVKDDLRGLLRTQRLYRAAQDHYGGFRDFPGRGFQPINGHYTIYLGPDDFMAAVRDNEEHQDEWIGAIAPGVSADAFTAIAVANLDDDPEMDVWMLTHAGEQTHLVNDNDYLETTPEAPPSSQTPAVAEGGAKTDAWGDTPELDAPAPEQPELEPTPAKIDAPPPSEPSTVRPEPNTPAPQPASESSAPPEPDAPDSEAPKPDQREDAERDDGEPEKSSEAEPQGPVEVVGDPGAEPVDG